MSSIKLAKLPDKTPVKLTIHLVPDLLQKLEDYAAAYEASYRHKIIVAELIPAMLDAYLQSDRDFSRRQKSP